MKKILWTTCLAALVCVTALAVATAQEKQASAKPDAAQAMTVKERADLAKQVDLFTQIASAGEAEKDPLMILTAVKLLDQLPAFGGIAKPGATDKSTYSRDALLAEAKEYAAGDAELLSVIAKIQDAPEATAVRGHRRHGEGHGYYYDRRFHHRRYRCEWIRVCSHHRGCEWVCEGRGGHRDWD